MHSFSVWIIKLCLFHSAARGKTSFFYMIKAKKKQDHSLWLLANWSRAKAETSANGKFHLFDEFKINIFTAQWVIKGIPVSPQSQVFIPAVMFNGASFTANRPFIKLTSVDREWRITQSKIHWEKEKKVNIEELCKSLW